MFEKESLLAEWHLYFIPSGAYNTNWTIIDKVNMSVSCICTV